MLEISIVPEKKKEINIKRYLKITHIFLSAMWYLPREIVDLAERLWSNSIKLEDWLQRVIAEKKAFNEKF